MLATFRSAPAHASCNVIPAAERVFVATLGEVSTPFARPGDPVTVKRAADVFATPVTDNHITVTFSVPGSAPVVVIAVPLADADCSPPRCLRFSFPDTDDPHRPGYDRADDGHAAGPYGADRHAVHRGLPHT